MAGLINLVVFFGILWLTFGMGYWQVGLAAVILGIIGATLDDLVKGYG